MPFSLRHKLCLVRKQLRSAALSALVFATGCRSHAPHALPVISVRSTSRISAVVPSPVAQVQSSTLYQQARQDCKRHDYLSAANRLQTLSQTPGLAPDAVAFLQQQKAICLKDAGQPVVTTVAAPPARTPQDADCGPRALLLVCQKLGVKTNLDTLRKSAGTTADGTTMEGLQKAAQQLGLKAEGVQVSREALPDVSLPAIAWDKRRHFIVVLSFSGSGEGGTAIIHDPNQASQEILSQESLLERCSGVLLLVHR